MPYRRFVWTLALLLLVAGCRTAPPGLKVEMAPLKMAGGWASEVRFVNTTEDTQILVVRNPVYVMTVTTPDGTEVFRRSVPLGKAEQLENILPRAYKGYTVTWTGKDATGKELPPGTYKVKLEFNAFYREQKVAVPDQTIELKE